MPTGGARSGQDKATRDPLAQLPATREGLTHADSEDVCYLCLQHFASGCKGVHLSATMLQDARLNGVLYKAGAVLNLPDCAETRRWKTLGVWQ